MSLSFLITGHTIHKSNNDFIPSSYYAIIYAFKKFCTIYVNPDQLPCEGKMECLQDFSLFPPKSTHRNSSPPTLDKSTTIKSTYLDDVRSQFLEDIM
jgi:hypothetical protein